MVKKILGAGGLAALVGLIPTANAQAQLPFFSGQRPPATYLLENRTILGKNSPEVNNITVLKTFRNEAPLWAYVGNCCDNDNGFGDFFYGIGPTINFGDNIHMSLTAEGSTKNPKVFSGGTIYSTLHFGRNWHVDLHPSFDGELDFSSANINIYHNPGKITYGISSDFKDKRFRSLRDVDFRVARMKSGNFIDLGINLGRKRLRVAVQKAFGRKK